MHDSDALTRFYEQAYSQSGPDAERYSRWRALGAEGKAEHVIELCRRARLAPEGVLEVGCGDGAVLSELARRGFGRERTGVEISPAAVAIARLHPGIDEVELFDGTRLPFPERRFDLGVLSHVLEHVPDPAALLGEAARVCAAVVFEVPLEANWSAGRREKLAHAAEVGHLRRLSRADARALAPAAGLRIVAELEDPLPLRAQRFFAEGPAGNAAALLRWAVRSGLHRLSPPLARRSFTLHYACLCLPRAS